MRAAIDIGTNTVRLLIGEVRDGKVVPAQYYRRITRLGGGYSGERGLSPEAMERTLCALAEMAEILRMSDVHSLRAVGTAALRDAANGPSFAETVRSLTGIPLEIISAEEEAALCTRGVLSVFEPSPDTCVIFDIGGGSTEFILCVDGEARFQRSYPLGVVRLCEQYSAPTAQEKIVEETMSSLLADLTSAGWREAAGGATLIGTAGTVTTLAALHMEMADYDWRRVNNFVLEAGDIDRLFHLLEPLAPAQRERLPGMERGRGDVILPGMRIVREILRRLQKKNIAVSDFGLLEGTLLNHVVRKGPSN